MKINVSAEMAAAKEAWNGDTDWCSFRDGWMARARQPRPVEDALQQRLNVADQRVDDLENFGKPDADGWYEWKGEWRTPPQGRVDVVFDDGRVIECQSANCWIWRHNGREDDIVKWRPAK